MSFRFTTTTDRRAPRGSANSPGCIVFFFGLFLLFGLGFLVVFATVAWRQMQSDPGTRGMAFLFALIPLIFVAVGLGGVVWGIRNWGKSPEELTAAAVDERKRPVSTEALPAFPAAKTEPGQFLAKRLKRATAPGCELAGLLFFALFWNSILSVFVWHVVREWQKGERPIFLTLFLIPFVLVGLFVVFWFIRQILVFAGVKETVVELEREPVCPGESVNLRIAQQGPVALYSLVATAKCTEEISHTRSTDIYHESHTLLERELLRLPAMRIQSRSTWEQSLEVEIPEGAMHSFEAPHNKIVWTVVVTGAVERWPDFEHAFPFRVAPPEARREIE